MNEKCLRFSLSGQGMWQERETEGIILGKYHIEPVKSKEAILPKYDLSNGRSSLDL